jgi:hypothetical protein
MQMLPIQVSADTLRQIMDAKSIQALLSRRPFMPFRVRMTDGAAIDVPKAESAQLRPGTLVIDRGPKRGGKSGGVVYCSLDHIVSLEIFRPV